MSFIDVEMLRAVTARIRAAGARRGALALAFAGSLALASALPLGAAEAANCTAADISAFSVSPAAIGAYTAFGAAPGPAPFTVSITTRANCTNLGLALSGLAGTFAPAAPSLAFTVTGGAPTTSFPLDVNVNRTTDTRTWTVSMGGGQVAPAGVYGTAGGTAGITVGLYTKHGNRLQQPPIRTAPLDVTVNVLGGCRLDPPTLASVDFSGAIVNGTASPNVVSSIVFPSATCTSPSRIRLSGAALQPIGAVTPRAGFDSLIDWRATASFGTATAVLTTGGTTPREGLSPTRNQGSGIGSTGSVALSINLVPGRQIVAGSYTGTLTVAIDPSF